MSIIFGIKAANGEPVSEQLMNQLAKATLQYAEDGTYASVIGGVGMGFQPYYTHERSWREAQPLLDAHKNILCFDGRLDNHAELRRMLGLRDLDVADSQIVLAAFERWTEGCFAQLVGDWALALWAPDDDSVYLARDHAGSRTLYYAVRDEGILWGTYLDTFIGAVEVNDLDQAYFARYLTCTPIQEITPYRGIRSVPPAHFVRIKGTVITQKAHWSWLAREQIQFKSDKEYEDQFLTLFMQSVERRTGPGAPILAQLSGGMDSSSVVCVSDYLRRQKGATFTDLLDTVSYFDDTEPNWNERPFFEAIEKHRGKKGIHLPYPLLSPRLDGIPIRHLWPGADHATLENERRLIESTRATQHRILLSGIGGDELLGGVPTALPELADLLMTGRVFGYLSRAVDWCLVDRTPLFQMTGQTLRFIAEQFRQSPVRNEALPNWISPSLRRTLEYSHPGTNFVSSPFSVSPSLIANARTGLSLLETLPVRPPRLLRRYEMRYPYLDRDLVDFLLRVPRERLLRPGRRRALMRNTLAGLVPGEVLERRRKGTRSRSVLRTLQSCEPEICQLFRGSSPWLQEFIDSSRLESGAIEAIRHSDMTKIPALLRAIHLHLWDKARRSWSVTEPVGAPR